MEIAFQSETDDHNNGHCSAAYEDYVSNPSVSFHDISSLKSNGILSAKDDTEIGDIISKHFSLLSKRHSNMTLMCPSAVKIRNGKVIKEKCISIYCTRKGVVPNGEELFPREIDGIKIDIFEGHLVPCIDTRHEQLQASCSISHKDHKCCGTLGGFCSATEGAKNDRFLTCLHCVLPPKAKHMADALDGIVVQPARLFKKYKPENKCGKTRGWNLCHALYNGRQCYMDVAVVEIIKGRVPNTTIFCNQLIDVNRFLFRKYFPDDFSFTSVAIHEPFTDIPDNMVFKLGQTTGLSVGEVKSQNASGTIPYRENLEMNCENVIKIKPSGGSRFAMKGDSGSWVFYKKNDKAYLVGIIFAVCRVEIGTAFACHIKPIMQKMRLHLP